jgi:A/G-specific adenine glycosylase
MTRALESWFVVHARPLAWRETGADGRRDPYRAFVAECMLQQTQVARVAAKFGPFLERFPDVRTLADADEDDVLAAWSGLGYYSRARRLHGAAKAIVEHHDATVPATAEELRTLPGIGRYSAGALASIVFGAREPIVDGNVQRVLVRVHGEERRLGARDTEAWAWERAAELVRACDDPALFNEGLMELGATVCMPRGPKCGACPIARWCVARREGRQEELPLPKERAKRREVWHGLALAVDDGRILLRRRPGEGLWAGLWAPPGVERASAEGLASAIERELGAGVGDRVGGFVYHTTHRIVRFELFRAQGLVERVPDLSSEGWFTREATASLGVSSAHARVIDLALADADDKGGA